MTRSIDLFCYLRIGIVVYWKFIKFLELIFCILMQNVENEILLKICFISYDDLIKMKQPFMRIFLKEIIILLLKNN